MCASPRLQLAPDKPVLGCRIYGNFRMQNLRILSLSWYPGITNFTRIARLHSGYHHKLCMQPLIHTARTLRLLTPGHSPVHRHTYELSRNVYDAGGKFQPPAQGLKE